MIERRAFVSGGLGALVTASCVAGCGVSPLGALSRISIEGRLSGCEIEYYTSGGLPPPRYRSDQFRVLTADGRDVLEFARPRYDVPVPPGSGQAYAYERTRLGASRDDVRTIARAFLASGAFSARFLEEWGPGRADLLSIEVIVSVNGKSYERRYFRHVPAALERLRAEVERRIEDVKAHGRGALFHNGVPLG